jgi:hypothetical protein
MRVSPEDFHGRPDNRESGCCTRCFVEQQEYAHPFAIYCPHLHRLVRVLSRRRYEVWDITPADIARVLEGGQGGQPE